MLSHVRPDVLADLTNAFPEDFQPYPGYASADGKEAKATQEELLVWVHSAITRTATGTRQYKFRTAVAGHMAVARETIAWVYGTAAWTSPASSTVRATQSRERQQASVRSSPTASPGAGGAFSIAQRWVHDLKYFNGLSLADQENLFGRTKSDSTRLDKQVPTSHLSHVELRDGETADASKSKRNEIVRRSTPYALHDGTVGLYFLGFCKDQAPLPRADGGDLRHERPDPGRPYRLLHPGFRVVLLRPVGRGSRRRPRVTAGRAYRPRPR